MSEPFLLRAELMADRVPSWDEHPYDVPAVRALDGLALDAPVTILVGENGSGKSTVVEALAVAAGFKPEAERFFNVASEIDRLAREEDRGRRLIESYGGVSLHRRSNGESFLALVNHRFGPDGLYLLDEPEAALSVRGCLALLAAMHDLVAAGSRFVVATHSPIVMGDPGARIYRLEEEGIEQVEYEDVEHVRLTRAFIDAPERCLRHLLAD